MPNAMLILFVNGQAEDRVRGVMHCGARKVWGVKCHLFISAVEYIKVITSQSFRILCLKGGPHEVGDGL